MSKKRMVVVTTGLIAAFTFWRASPRTVVAQLLERDAVEIPGIGAVDLTAVPPEIRDNLRIPGVAYDEPQQEYGDLPPVPMPPSDEAPPAESGTVWMPAEGPEAVNELPLVGDDDYTSEKYKDAERERWRAQQESRRRFYDGHTFPEGAYRQAWDYMQQMQPAQPPPPPPQLKPEDPQSRTFSAPRWLARAYEAFSPFAAFAQTPSYQWTQVGPAPLIADPNEGGANNAGLISYIALDPQKRDHRISRNGRWGIWRTTNLAPTGTTWAPLTDRQPSMQNEAIAVHPGNAQIIFAGTGPNGFGLVDPPTPERAVGVLRSTDGGTFWCRIGPAARRAPAPDRTARAT